MGLPGSHCLAPSKSLIDHCHCYGSLVAQRIPYTLGRSIASGSCCVGLPINGFSETRSLRCARRSKRCSLSRRSARHRSRWRRYGNQPTQTSQVKLQLDCLTLSPYAARLARARESSGCRSTDSSGGRRVNAESQGCRSRSQSEVHCFSNGSSPCGRRCARVPAPMWVLCCTQGASRCVGRAARQARCAADRPTVPRYATNDL
jgi:hypothetical protein